ncbi:DUF3592 domain-containing protein [Variovorax rhizosphaerae]|uniref:DUF3592 domain-containing protein n=1 Tax=Variovorax rhizosphaerae TaxID=1836200 RepID=A0ABU8WI55_9BURK
MDKLLSPLGLKILLFAVIFLLCAAPMGGDLVRASKTRSWPSVHGQFVAKGIAETGTDDTDCPTAWVRYEYAVAGVRYKNDRIRSTPWCVSTAERSEFNARYTGVDTLTVYYNPTMPQDSLLEPGRTGRTWKSLFILTGFVVFAFAVSLLHRE